MIQKAIVESIEGEYQVKVRIPKYDKMSTDGFSYDELSTSIICSSPGTLVNYSVGDIVLVGFENNEINKPVVLGLLYTNNNSGDSIKFPELSDAMESMASSIDKLKKANSHIYIRYSNDGGATFTSLYDYSDEEYDSGTRTYSASNIEISPKSKFVAWDITDSRGQNALDDFEITTTISVPNLPDISFTDKVFDVPLTYRNISGITLSYELVCGGDKSEYNIALYTDKNELGTVEGDYIGFYYTTNQHPSLNPIDYSWASIKVRLQKFIDEAFDSLLKRVRANEIYLYGQIQEPNAPANTETGINSALQVQTNALNVSLKPEVIMSGDTAIKLDTQQNYLYFNGLVLEAADNGHLRIVVR